MSSSKAILYSDWRSSCSYRVRIALNLKKIPYEIKKVDDFEAYAAINPTKYVPALQIDGDTLIESIAIMHYLDEAYPESYQLLPKDAIKRCKVREISEVIASGIQPIQNMGLLEHLDEDKRKEWAQFWICRGLGAVEKLLSASAGKFCVGDEITMADCCLLPQLYNARRRYDVDLSPYSNIVRIEEELESLPEFVAAHPFNQPDSPASDRREFDSLYAHIGFKST